MSDDQHWLTEDGPPLMPELPDSRVKLHSPEKALKELGIEKVKAAPSEFAGDVQATKDDFGAKIEDLRRTDGLVTDPITSRQVQVNMKQAEAIARKSNGRVVLQFVNDAFAKEKFIKRVEQVARKLD